jgi:hypothetical protein
MGYVIKTTKTAKTTSSAAAYKLCNAAIPRKENNTWPIKRQNN